MSSANWPVGTVGFAPHFNSHVQGWRKEAIQLDALMYRLTNCDDYSEWTSKDLLLLRYLVDEVLQARFIQAEMESRSNKLVEQVLVQPVVWAV